MATRHPKKRREEHEDEATRFQRNRYAIEQARRNLDSGPLGPLLAAVRVEEWRGSSDAAVPPYVGVADPAGGVIFLNPRHTRKNKSAGTAEWEFLIGHLLLHLGLNHAARREDREPLLWNLACEYAVDRLLGALGIGNGTHYAQETWPGDASEESIYGELSASREMQRLSGEPTTLAGRGRPDIAGIGRAHAFRNDHEEKLALGIRRAAQEAVARAADAMEDFGKDSWPPVERARRWVLSEFPLLGALATEVRIIADATLCDRLDIPIAAVNGFLGEMYLHPDCAFSDDEVRFVYVHELLHVALLHHSRAAHRDPFVWNLACDFVINAWLIEMGVGKMPRIGGLYDPRLAGMSAEQVYDLLMADPRQCKNLRGFRGRLGDVLADVPGRRVYRGDVSTLDDVYRRCLGAGLSCCQRGFGRGLVPAGLMEEIRSLFTPPVPWDVELARWMDRHVPLLRDWRRTYARASRRQSSTPDIPRPARYLPQEVVAACTFGVVLDTSGSMDRETLGRALGAIASYAEARDVPAVRLVLCDAAPYDRGYVTPADLRGVFPVQGRGGTVLQPAVAHLMGRPDFPPSAPVMILTDGWCEEEILCPREHCFVLPRKSWKEGALPLRTSAPIFRVLKQEAYE